jgi:hypothetical protein
VRRCHVPAIVPGGTQEPKDIKSHQNRAFCVPSTNKTLIWCEQTLLAKGRLADGARCPKKALAQKLHKTLCLDGGLGSGRVVVSITKSK